MIVHVVMSETKYDAGPSSVHRTQARAAAAMRKYIAAAWAKDMAGEMPTDLDEAAQELVTGTDHRYWIETVALDD
jgi:hypothetical protein